MENDLPRVTSSHSLKFGVCGVRVFLPAPKLLSIDNLCSYFSSTTDRSRFGQDVRMTLKLCCGRVLRQKYYYLLPFRLLRNDGTPHAR